MLTASPAKLHGMVADAAVRHAAAAAEALAAGDREAGHLACSKASACAADLVAGLNPDAAGAGDAGAKEEMKEVKEVTDRLAGLFAFCVEKLCEADRTGEPAPAADAARVLGVHAETWRELRASLGPDADAKAGGRPATVPAPHFAAAPPAAGYGDETVGVSWAA